MINRNFNKIYQEIYNNGITELTRSKRIKDASAFAFVIFLILTVWIIYKNSMSIEKSAFYIFVLPIILFVYIIAQSNYRKTFKELVIRRIIYLYNPDFTFSAKSGVSSGEYVESFFDNDFDRFYSEDLIQGKILNEYDFKMAQVKTEVEEKKIDNEGKAHYETHTLFHGLFGIVDIQDSMIMKMDITSNNFLNKYNKDRIEVDSGEFEKNYDMFSTDKVRTMEIFTSDIIEEFNKFEDETDYVMQIKVVPNRLYFRISCGEAFEAPVVKGALSYDYLYRNFKMIDFPINIISRMIENALETRR